MSPLKTTSVTVRVPLCPAQPAPVIIVYPLIQRKRDLVGIHAEAIDQITGDTPFLLIRIVQDGAAGDFLELLYQPLIVGIMHMAVEHIGSWVSLFIQPILPVITQDRIMAQDKLAPVVTQFLIGLNPFKTAGIVFFILQKRIVVSLNQI